MNLQVPKAGKMEDDESMNLQVPKTGKEEYDESNGKSRDTATKTMSSTIESADLDISGKLEATGKEEDDESNDKSRDTATKTISSTIESADLDISGKLEAILLCRSDLESLHRNSSTARAASGDSLVAAVAQSWLQRTLPLRSQQFAQRLDGLAAGKARSAAASVVEGAMRVLLQLDSIVSKGDASVMAARRSAVKAAQRLLKEADGVVDSTERVLKLVQAISRSPQSSSSSRAGTVRSEVETLSGAKRTSEEVSGVESAPGTARSMDETLSCAKRTSEEVSSVESAPDAPTTCPPPQYRARQLSDSVVLEIEVGGDSEFRIAFEPGRKLSVTGRCLRGSWQLRFQLARGLSDNIDDVEAVTSHGVLRIFVPRTSSSSGWVAAPRVVRQRGGRCRPQRACYHHPRALFSPLGGFV